MRRFGLDSTTRVRTAGALNLLVFALLAPIVLGASDTIRSAPKRWAHVSFELGLAPERELPSAVVVGLPDSSRHGSVSALRSYDPTDPVRTRVPARTTAAHGKGTPLAGVRECTSEEVPALARVQFVLPPEERDAPLEGATVRTAPSPDGAPGVCLRKIETWVPTWRESLEAMRRKR